MIFLADVDFTSSPQSVVGIVDTKVRLNCEARGESVEVIEWTVGNGTVLSDSVFDILSELTANGIRAIKQLNLSCLMDRYNLSALQELP